MTMSPIAIVLPFFIFLFLTVENQTIKLKPCTDVHIAKNINQMIINSWYLPKFSLYIFCLPNNVFYKKSTISNIIFQNKKFKHKKPKMSIKDERSNIFPEQPALF